MSKANVGINSDKTIGDRDDDLNLKLLETLLLFRCAPILRSILNS